MSKNLEINTLNDVIVPNARHIYILVPGTTDPVNSFANIQHNPDSKKQLGLHETTNRANSYKSTSMYWDDKFYQGMVKLENNIDDFIIFDKFGWSGDNCVSNREVAGKYLVRRLYMPDKYNKQGYYEPIKEKPVYFHLIGHSHGGNVINEMTKEIDKLPQWPEKWKVKSITYLSTPFFKKLHQVKVTTKVFHKDAQILHVYNDYDLTQNFLADFSMFDLSLIDKILKEKKVISTRKKPPTNKADEKGKIIQEGLIDKCKTAYSNIPTNKLTDLWLSEKEGKDFYDKSIKFFESLENVFHSKDPNDENIIVGLLEAIKELNKEIEFKVSDFLKETIPKDELKTTRQILDDESYLMLKHILDEILQGIKKLEVKFNDTKDKVEKGETSYSRGRIFDDLSASKDLIDTLTSVLDIEENTLISLNPNSIWNLLFKILDNSIDTFDNTYVFPQQQFKGTFLEDKIKPLDVTKKDEYDKKTAQTKSSNNLSRALVSSNTTPLFGIQQSVDDMMNPKVFSERYYKLLSKIKEQEDNYLSSPNQTNLMDMLFTLIAHSPVHKGIDSWSNLGLFGISVVLDKEAEISLDKFKVIINKLKRVFNKRYVGNLEAFNMGDLMYFMQESHSTSRRYLHEEVEDFLKKAMK